VIAILVESAAPLTAFGVISAVLLQANNSLEITSPALYVCDYLFQGLFLSFCVSSNNQIFQQLLFVDLLFS
jgi:hypothetical protein